MEQGHYCFPFKSYFYFRFTVCHFEFSQSVEVRQCRYCHRRVSCDRKCGGNLDSLWNFFDISFRSRDAKYFNMQNMQ